MNIRTFSILVSFAFLFSCSGSDDPAEKDEKVTFTLLHNNTYTSLVKCAVSGDGIKCDESTRSPIPPLSLYRPFAGIDAWKTIPFIEGPDGCFEGYQGAKNNEGPDTVTPLESITKNDSCAPVIRLLDGEGQKLNEFKVLSGSPLPNNYSRLLSSLEEHTLQVRNVNGADRCTMSYKLGGDKKERELEINEADVKFSSLFSLHYDINKHPPKSTSSKSADFTYNWTPALDTAPLIAAGMSDSDVIALLEKHLGDFVILRASDSYGRALTCKARDAVTGAITIPASLMGRFDGSTSFSITRYQYVRKPLSSNAEVLLLIAVAEYEDRTDTGAISGGLTVNIID